LEQEETKKGVVLDFYREFGKKKEEGNHENKGEDLRNEGDNEGD